MIWIGSQNWGILQTRRAKGGTTSKWILTIFQYKTVRAEKVDVKKWGHLSSFHVSFLSYDLQIVQKEHFLQFCADILCKKSKSVKAIFIYASKSSHYTLSENAMVYRGLSHRSWYVTNH